MRKIKSVKQQALIDITKHNRDVGYSIFGKDFMDFMIGSKYLDTKENRKLNRELGIHKINYKNDYEKLKQLHRPT